LDIRSIFTHHGLVRSIEALSIGGVNKVALFTSLKFMKLEFQRSEWLNSPACYYGQVLSEDILRGYADRPEYELPHNFLDQAFAKGDECYGYFAGNVLVHYDWFSRKDTKTKWRGLEVRIHPHYVYSYKGFTHSQHRGKGLFSMGLTRALGVYKSQGYKGLVGYAEGVNYNSQKSLVHTGYSQIGTIYVFGMYDSYWIHSTSECDRFGVSLVLNP
jgi:hypothetical protein